MIVTVLTLVNPVCLVSIWSIPLPASNLITIELERVNIYNSSCLSTGLHYAKAITNNGKAPKKLIREQ